MASARHFAWGIARCERVQFIRARILFGWPQQRRLRGGGGARKRERKRRARAKGKDSCRSTKQLILSPGGIFYGRYNLQDTSLKATRVYQRKPPPRPRSGPSPRIAALASADTRSLSSSLTAPDEPFDEPCNFFRTVAVPICPALSFSDLFIGNLADISAARIAACILQSRRAQALAFGTFAGSSRSSRFLLILREHELTCNRSRSRASPSTIPCPRNLPLSVSLKALPALAWDARVHLVRANVSPPVH